MQIWAHFVKAKLISIQSSNHKMGQEAAGNKVGDLNGMPVYPRAHTHAPTHYEQFRDQNPKARIFRLWKKREQHEENKQMIDPAAGGEALYPWKCEARPTMPSDQ